MVHPASGYMVGSLLRRGPDLAQALAAALANPSLGSAALAQRGWQALWPIELVLRHQLYQFGLGRLMGFNEALLRTHFATFFPAAGGVVWFLTNTCLPADGRDAALVCPIPWDLRRGLVLGALRIKLRGFEIVSGKTPIPQ